MIKVAVSQYQLECLPNWEQYAKKIETLVLQAKQQGANILVLPEYCGIEAAGYHATDLELYAALQPLLPKYLELFSDLAKKHQMYIQAGTILAEVAPGKYANRAYFFGPNGTYGYQDKLQLIEYEKQQKIIVPGKEQTLFETEFGKVGIAICYDSESPEIVRKLTLAGAWLILVPSYTISNAGYHRVFLSCRARAIENQCYVATSYIVGTVHLTEPAEDTIGHAVILGPADTGFPSNGIMVQSETKEAVILTAELNKEKLFRLREEGNTRNFEDSQQYLKNTPRKFNTMKI